MTDCGMDIGNKAILSAGHSDSGRPAKKAKQDEPEDPPPAPESIELQDHDLNPMLVDVVLRHLFGYFSTPEVKEFRLVCHNWNEAACAELKDRKMLVELNDLRAPSRSKNPKKKITVVKFLKDLKTGEQFPNLDRLEVNNLIVHNLRFEQHFVELFVMHGYMLTELTLVGMFMNEIHSVVEHIPIVMPQLKSLTFLDARYGTEYMPPPIVPTAHIPESDRNKHLKYFKMALSISFAMPFNFGWHMIINRSPQLTTLELETYHRDEMWTMMSQIHTLMSWPGQKTNIQHLSVKTQKAYEGGGVPDPTQFYKLQPAIVDGIINFCNSFQLKSLCLDVELYGSDFNRVFSSITAPTEKLKLMKTFPRYNQWMIRSDVASSGLTALCGPNFHLLPEVEVSFKLTSLVNRETVSHFTERAMLSVTKLTLDSTDFTADHDLLFFIFPQMADIFPNLTALCVWLRSPKALEDVLRNLKKFPKLERLVIGCYGQTPSTMVQHRIFFGSYKPALGFGLHGCPNLEDLVIDVPHVHVKSIMITEGFMKMDKLKKLTVPASWEFSASKFEDQLMDKLKLRYI